MSQKLAAAQWNQLFTGMLRQNDQTAWGNWTLDPSIVPGAVGIVDPNTGAFTPISKLPNAKLQFTNESQSWSLESAGIERTETSVDFKGGYLDPSTGVEVKVGTKADWSFAHENSISSNGRIAGMGAVDDFATAMQSEFPWLLDQAKAAGYGSDAGIDQGFGVVIRTWACNGAINIGSEQTSSSFSLTGSVEGVAAMTGEGSVDASIEGSYKDTNQSTSFDSHMFPADANKAANGQAALSYYFASYDGTILMPRWTGILTNLCLVFNNAHGGTYIAKCNVDYDVPDGHNGTQHKHDEVTASGGMTRTIADVPLNATNMVVVIKLEAGDSFTFRWPTPLAAWINGQVTFDIRGVWPWGGHVKASA